MIIDLLVGIVTAILTGVFALIPSYTLPSLSGLGSGLGSGLAIANAVFPVTVLGVCLAAIMGAKIFILSFDVVSWLYRRVPMKFT